MSNIVIGIEGYVGAGKSAICKELLKYIPNSIILEGGNLYRAVVFSILNSGVDLENLKNGMENVDILSIMKKLNVEIKIENRVTEIYVNGKKIEEDDMQSVDSSIAVSTVASVANNEKLYVFARKLINQFKQEYNVIVSGRALMEIYPNLDYHFLITASLEERIRRKCIKYNQKVEKEKVKENIINRDHLQEKAGYYKVYDKTIVVDVTDCKTVNDSCQKVLKYIEM